MRFTTTKAPVEWVDYNRKMLCQLFQNGDTKEYKLLAGPNGKCVAGGKETEIPNLIVAVKKKPSAPLKEQAVEEEEKEDEEEEELSLSQAVKPKRRKIEKDDSADPPVDPPVDSPVEEQEENEEEDEEDNVDEVEEEEKELKEEEQKEEEHWEEDCEKVVAVGEGKKKAKGNRAKGWTYMWYKNGHSIGIRQKHGEKRQIFSFGGKRFASDFSEGRMRLIAQSVIHKLEQGILKESTANAWVQNEHFS